MTTPPPRKQAKHSRMMMFRLAWQLPFNRHIHMDIIHGAKTCLDISKLMAACKLFLRIKIKRRIKNQFERNKGVTLSDDIDSSKFLDWSYRFTKSELYQITEKARTFKSNNNVRLARTYRDNKDVLIHQDLKPKVRKESSINNGKYDDRRLMQSKKIGKTWTTRHAIWWSIKKSVFPIASRQFF